MGENPAEEPASGNSISQAQIVNPTGSVLSGPQANEENAALGMMGLFDGPADEDRPFLQHPALWNGQHNSPIPTDQSTAQYGQYDGGRWVWQQQQIPFDGPPWQRQYYHPSAQDYNQSQAPQHQSPVHQEARSPSPLSPRDHSRNTQYHRGDPQARPDKQVRFDFGEHAGPSPPGGQYHPGPTSAVRERPAMKHFRPPYNMYTHRESPVRSYEAQQIPSPRAQRASSQASWTGPHVRSNLQSRQTSQPQFSNPTESRGGPATTTGTINNVHSPPPGVTFPGPFYVHQPQFSVPPYATQLPTYAVPPTGQAPYIPVNQPAQQATPYFFAAAGAPPYRPGYSHPTYAAQPPQSSGAPSWWPPVMGLGLPNWSLPFSLPTQHPSSVPVSPAVSPKTKPGLPDNANAQSGSSTLADDNLGDTSTNDTPQGDSWAAASGATTTNGDTNTNVTSDGCGGSGATDNWGNGAGTGDSWQQGDNNKDTAGNDWENSNNGINNDTWDAPNDAGSGGKDDWQNTTVDKPKEDSNSAPQAVASVAGRDLYGPFGPYYSTRTTEADDPRPDVEEEPRYDVPFTFAQAYGSTKQVQPGPGYRYYKRSQKPKYLDDLSQPYARFVFKYRTKEQLEKEIGVKVDVEPSGNQEIRQLQDLTKEDLIQMLLRAKSGLGGKIPSPPETPPSRDDGIVQPRFVNRPDVSFLRYESLIPQPRPPVAQAEHTPNAQQWSAGGWDGAKPESIKPATKENQSSPKERDAQSSAEQKGTTSRDWTDIAASWDQPQQEDTATQKNDQTVSIPWTAPPPPPSPPANSSQPVDTAWTTGALSGADMNASGCW